jgi:DNA-binding transcriptional ArsR family regulator
MVVRRRLDRVFHAMADPTRRRMLKALAEGPRNVRQLAAPFRMSYTAASKHILVLEAAGLLRRKRKGRMQECRILPYGLKTAYGYLHSFREVWREADRLLE